MNSGESPPARRVVATPLARMRSKQLGVLLEHISGSGPAGRVVVRDVERHLDLTAGTISSPSPKVEWSPEARRRIVDKLRHRRHGQLMFRSTVVEVTQLRKLWAGKASAFDWEVLLTGALFKCVEDSYLLSRLNDSGQRLSGIPTKPKLGIAVDTVSAPLWALCPKSPRWTSSRQQAPWSDWLHGWDLGEFKSEIWQQSH